MVWVDLKLDHHDITWNTKQEQSSWKSEPEINIIHA